MVPAKQNRFFFNFGFYQFAPYCWFFSDNVKDPNISPVSIWEELFHGILFVDWDTYYML